MYRVEFDYYEVMFKGLRTPTEHPEERTQRIFEELFDVRSQAFLEARLAEDRKRRAIELMNLFRAFHTGPIVQGFDQAVVFRALRSICEPVMQVLEWHEMDVMGIPASQKPDVDALKTQIFKTERYGPQFQRASIFGVLDTTRIDQSYGGSWEEYDV